MTLSKIPRPLTVSARKDSTWRTSKPVLGIRQLDHGFEQQAQWPYNSGPPHQPYLPHHPTGPDSDTRSIDDDKKSNRGAPLNTHDHDSREA